MSELEKAQEIQEKSRTIADFVDWLEASKEIRLAKHEPGFIGPLLKNEVPSIDELLCEYFGIDYAKYKEELDQEYYKLLRKQEAPATFHRSN